MKKKTAIIIVFLVVFALITYFLLSENTKIEKSRIIQRNLNFTNGLARDIDQYLSTRILMMNMMGGYFEGYWEINNYNLGKYITPILYKDKYISSFMALDNKGAIIFEYHKNLNRQESTALYKTALLPYLQYPLKGEHFISNLINTKLFPEEIITLASPLYHEDKVGGGLFLTLKTEVFKELLHDKAVGQNGYVALRDGLGNVLFHPQLELIREKDYKFLDVPLMSQGGYKITRSSFDNTKEYITYKPLQKANWMMFVMQPLIEYQGPINLVWLKNGFLLIILFFCMYLVFYLEQQEKKIIKTELKNERLETVANLAAGIAHEIKNPLVPIKGFIQMEKKKGNSTLGNETIALLLEEIHRIEKVINDFLNLAKNKKPDFNTLDLYAILKDTIFLMQAQAVKKGVILNFIFSESTQKIKINGDKDQLLQVFMNLIKNAIEATQIDGKVTIEVTNSEHQAIVLITDTGQGIPDNVLEKIGTPFFTTKDDGTGLGLMVSERIVNNHGGQLEIDSQVNKGTTVKVYLPLEQTVKK